MPLNDSVVGLPPLIWCWARRISDCIFLFLVGKQVDTIWICMCIFFKTIFRPFAAPGKCRPPPPHPSLRHCVPVYVWLRLFLRKLTREFIWWIPRTNNIFWLIFTALKNEWNWMNEWTLLADSQNAVLLPRTTYNIVVIVQYLSQTCSLFSHLLRGQWREITWF